MFFGNVWQKIAQILLCVCIVSTLVNCQGVTGEAGGAVGENAGSIRARERVCRATTDEFFREMTNDEDSVFTRWKENVQSVWNFFSRKPSTRKLIFHLDCTHVLSPHSALSYSSNLLKVYSYTCIILRDT